MFECRNHPGADAAWMCAGCEGVYCDDCVTPRKYGRGELQTCKGCGELCHAVQGGIEIREVAAGPYSDAFHYPLRESGPWMILGGTVFATLLGVLAGGAVIGWGIFLGYGMTIIRSTAEGRANAPDWPEVSSVGDLLWPALLGAATVALAFGPAFWALGQERLGLALLLTGAGAAYAPMAWIAASMSERILGLVWQQNREELGIS